MPAPTAHLTHTLTWDYQDWRGRDREIDVTVEYTIARGEIEFGQFTYGGPELPDAEVERICDYIESEIAPEDFAEWEADRGDYLYEQMRDDRMDRSLLA